MTEIGSKVGRMDEIRLRVTDLETFLPETLGDKAALSQPLVG